MIRDYLLGGMQAVTRGLALSLFLVSGAPAQSGDPFAAVAYVNDRAITGFELEQRMTILGLFRTPGDLHKLAMEQLIDDRLRLDAATMYGVEAPEEAISDGMAEFAGRANLDVDTFLAQLASAGVAPETMRDFIKAGIVWREIVRGRFGPRAEVTDAELDRALSLSDRRGSVVVELAEIMLPARDAAEAADSQALAQDLRANINGTADFAEAARQYSVVPSGAQGGRTGRAIPVNELPGSLRTQIMALTPGQITEPIQGGNVIAMFQLLSLRESGATEVVPVTVDYAEYLIPGGRTEVTLREAAKVAEKVDTCDDLYGINRKQSPERLMRYSRPTAEVPRDVAMELAKLDDGEVSTALTRGGNLVFLMLCGRAPDAEGAPDREAMRQELYSQRLAAYGESYLAELRADAFIRYP